MTKPISLAIAATIVLATLSACDPECDEAWVEKCGTTSGGIQFTGQPHPQSCGDCPKGTYYSGVDNSTAGGPYNICMCNGQ